MFEKCPNCGKTHILKPKACGCGYDFEKKEEEFKILCPKDNTELKLEWFECPKCKTPLNELIRYPCPKCGNIVGLKDKYCKCGEKLLIEVTTCPYCKSKIDAESTTCPKCGRSFYAQEHEHTAAEYHCPRCGYKLPTAASNCPICE